MMLLPYEDRGPMDVVASLLKRSIDASAPPEARTKEENNPTLLVSWWATGFALAVIAIRLAGRLVRNNHFFREDKIMALSIIPLLARMALVHVIMIWGTNNAVGDFDAQEIRNRSIGSRLVLASRISYAAFIWLAKLAVSEFLKRLTDRFWNKRSQYLLHGIRIFLGLTFVGVIIATLAECQPFDHYWQVVPDPGPQCRQGYAQLITMGVSDIVTDVLLIVFPIPIVIRSAMPLKRKISLVALFSLSILLILITALRVPAVIAHHGRQQYRTVWASAEILAAAAVSNAIALGSFLRDRGVKKTKYRFGSTTDSMDRPQASRRPTLTQWGSDEDLVRDMGYGLHPELRGVPNLPRAPPAALPAGNGIERRRSSLHDNWQFPKGEEVRDSEDSDLKMQPSAEPMPGPRQVVASPSPKRNVSFFDAGGLLDDDDSRSSTIAPSASSNISAQDFASSRRGSRALLSDLGGLLSPTRSQPQRQWPLKEEEDVELASQEALKPPASSTNTTHAPVGVPVPRMNRQDTDLSLQDAGGLLSDPEQSIPQYPHRSSLPHSPPRNSPNFSLPRNVHSPPPLGT